MLDARLLIVSSILVASKESMQDYKNYTKYCNFPFQPKRVLYGYGITFEVRSMRFTVNFVCCVHFHAGHYAIMFLLLSGDFSLAGSECKILKTSSL